MKVCIYAAASDKIDPKYIYGAESLGYRIGSNGDIIIIYGAGSTGLMGAVARGFRKANGNLIGVTPHFIHEREPVFEDCTTIIKTETMADRKEVMENNADAFLMLPGGIGTWDEMFQCLTLKDLNRHQKQIIIYNMFDFYTPLIAYLRQCIQQGFVNPKVGNFFHVTNNKDDVIDELQRLNNNKF